MLLATIQLIDHKIYSETINHIMELYSENNYLEYHYGWERTNGNKHTKHISAWGNEPHPTGHRRVENTEPFHHRRRFFGKKC
jgi:hypothetical protein